MTSKKLPDPSLLFVRTLMSLYFTDTVEPYSGIKEVEALPLMEALVLGFMGLNGKR